LGVESGKGKSVFNGGTFPSQALRLVSASRVSRSRFLAQLTFVSSAMFRVGCIQSLKSASSFFSVRFWFALVLKGYVSFFGKVHGRFCRFSKLAGLLSAKFQVS